MRYWAQFYHLRGDRYVEGAGDRQLVYIDGRLNRGNMNAIAAKECSRRGYDGWRLARGEHLLNPFYLTAAVKSATNPHALHTSVGLWGSVT